MAARETQALEARGHYTYRQHVRIEEMSPKGGIAGIYREDREVTFSPAGERTERMVGRPFENLPRLKLTEEDFRDIREVQPFLLVTDQLWLYETKFRGEETVDGADFWLLEVRPRQIHQGHRFPVHTHADDTLPFSSGPLRLRMTIKFSDYREFSASSTVTFR